ncbi:ABC transporter transmembrane domain-containing protein [Streptomyces sp. x-80]|uniref:ABC transporter transmembrane domain-containing protein n=1 Tax=Streptomyces sp. x-80 TaxID=2789282 RepID=UPI00397FF408
MADASTGPDIPGHRSAGRYLWWLIVSQWWRVGRGATLGSLWMVALMLPPYVLSRAIDDGLTPGRTATLLGWIAVLLAVGALNAWLGIMRHRTMTRIRMDASIRTVRALVAQTMRLGAALPRKVTAGEVVTIGIGDVGVISQTLTITGPGVGAVLAYVVVAVLLLNVSPLLAATVLLGVPLLAVLVGPLLGRLAGVETRYRERQSGLAARLTDLVGGLRVLNGLGGKDVFAARYRHDSRSLRSEGYRVGAVASWIQALGVGLPALFLAVVTWLAARMAAQGTITVGELVAVYGYTAELVAPVTFLIEGGYDLTRGLVAARRVVRFLGLEPDSVRPAAVRPDSVRPDSMRPDSMRPDSAEPGAVRLEATEPGSARAGSGTPASPRPGATTPGSVRPDSAKPGSVQPEATEPASGTPGPGEHVSGAPNSVAAGPLTSGSVTADSMTADSVTSDSVTSGSSEPDAGAAGSATSDSVDGPGGGTRDGAGPEMAAVLRDPVSGVEVLPGSLTALAGGRPAASAAVLDRLGGFAESAATWGAVRLDEIALARLRDRILVADNEADLFAGTLREVVSGRRNRTEEAIHRALHTAMAQDIVRGLPGGLDSAVEAQGRNLSGGQRQRLRLVRALLADPEVLLAVEPTSAVDAHTEAGVAARLHTARAGRTTVVTSTSPLLLDRADTVYYLVDGQVAAVGSHRELLTAEPGYRRLVSRGEDDSESGSRGERGCEGEGRGDADAADTADTTDSALAPSAVSAPRAPAPRDGVR